MLKTSDSDKDSYSRFARRTFSATMIELHHLLTIQIGESTLSSVIMTLVLCVRIITWYGRIFPSQEWIFTKVTWFGLIIMWRKCTISSWLFLCNGINSYAPPSSINRRMNWSFCAQQRTIIWKELLLCKNHLSTKTTWIQLELISTSKTLASASDHYSSWTLVFCY